MSLRTRFVAVFSVFSLFSLVCGALALVFSLRANMQVLYRSVQEQIALCAKNIEAELEHIEKLSAGIMTDLEFQRLLEVVDTTADPFVRTNAVRALHDMLAVYAFPEHYVTTIDAIDARGNEYPVYVYVHDIEDSDKRKAIRSAREAGGAHVFVGPQGPGSYLLSSRAVIKVKDLSLEDLGAVVIGIDMAKLLRDSAEVLDEYRVDLAISSSGSLLYTTSRHLDPAEALRVMTGSRGYEIAQISGESYFVTRMDSASLDWEYVLLLSYAEVVRGIRTANTIILACYGAMLLIVFLVGLNTISRIARPVKALADEIRTVVESGFTVWDDGTDRRWPDDELGTLHTEFRSMISRMRVLIDEDYRKQIMLKNAQIATLQLQINPHFLYNTLDSVNWMARASGQTTIAVMVKALGRLMKTAMSSDQSLIPLGEEAGFLEDYLSIQKIRYEDRLQMTMELPESLSDYLVPKLILQPVVENAIKYSVERTADPCRISVTGYERQGSIVITVTDNGIGMAADLIESVLAEPPRREPSGVGLRNVNERLRLVFGREGSLRIDSDGERGTTVRLSMPKWRDERSGTEPDRQP